MVFRESFPKYHADCLPFNKITSGVICSVSTSSRALSICFWRRRTICVVFGKRFPENHLLGRWNLLLFGLRAFIKRGIGQGGWICRQKIVHNAEVDFFRKFSGKNCPNWVPLKRFIGRGCCEGPPWELQKWRRKNVWESKSEPGFCLWCWQFRSLLFFR